MSADILMIWESSPHRDEDTVEGDSANGRELRCRKRAINFLRLIGRARTPLFFFPFRGVQPQLILDFYARLLDESVCAFVYIYICTYTRDKSALALEMLTTCSVFYFLFFLSLSLLLYRWKKCYYRDSIGLLH